MRKIYECDNQGNFVSSGKIHVFDRDDELIELKDEHKSIFLSKEAAYDVIKALAEIIELNWC